MDWLIQNGHFGEASQLHSEHTGADVMLLRRMADVKQVEIGTRQMKWIKEVSPSLVLTISSDLSTSLCSSSGP
ncbi:unnamed protein product [Brassica oleracea var. botrytis]